MYEANLKSYTSPLKPQYEHPHSPHDSHIPYVTTGSWENLTKTQDI